jgi:ABC-type multidrug transport system ATPase subunit
MEEAEAMAGRIGIMSAGRLLADGDYDELVRQSGLTPRREVRAWPRLQDLYLAIVGERLDARSQSA